MIICTKCVECFIQYTFNLLTLNRNYININFENALYMCLYMCKYMGNFFPHS